MFAVLRYGCFNIVYDIILKMQELFYLNNKPFELLGEACAMNCIIVSEQANEILKEYLRKRTYHIIEIKSTNHVYEAVSSHGDMYVCKIGNTAIIAPEQLEYVCCELDMNKIDYETGVSKLGYKYPENIKYNGVWLGSYFIHNVKYTDKKILAEANKKVLDIIDVKQGYTKCNIVAVDHGSVITSDIGIATQLKKFEIDVLLIRPGYVRLKGFEYGFLGGASGRVGNDIIFNGNLEIHPDYQKIIDFIGSKGLGTIFFREYPLEDIGSIIEMSPVR